MQRKSVPDNLTRVNSIQSIKDSTTLFKLITQSFNWKDLLNSHVTSHIEGRTRRREYGEIVKRFVEGRDVLDRNIYEKVVKSIFPDMAFTIKDYADSKIDNNTFRFVTRWYHFRIFNGGNTGVKYFDDTGEKYLQITIKAPGSRDLTSDIDTSISVSGAENLTALDCLRVVSHDGDYNELIKLTIIQRFYEFSRKMFDLNSAEHRDSNVYGDGFLEKDEAPSSSTSSVRDEAKESNYINFPKFQNTVQLNDEKENKVPLIETNIYKKNKHTYELAASLISLRLSMDETAWGGFISLVEREINAQFSKDPSKGGLSIKDFKKGCEQVEEFYEHYKQKITGSDSSHVKEVQEIAGERKEDKAIASPEVLHEEKVNVDVLNDLYVEGLRIVAGLQRQISEKDEQIKKLKEEMEEVRKKLKATPPPIQAIIAQLNGELNTKNNSIIEALKEKAELQNDKQKALIEANLFANEAYINRSAVYHIVEGTQGGQELKLSKRTLMCSLLQQIGMKLLHEKEQLKAGIEVGMVACNVSKYGARVAELVFSQNKLALTDEEVVRIREDGAPPEKARILKLLDGNTHYTAFSTPEYHLLNSEIQIYQVKKDRNISYAEQAEKAKGILESRLSNIGISSETKEGDLLKHTQNLWLSIAAKTISATYQAKIRNAAGHLWADRVTTCRQWIFKSRKYGTVKDTPAEVTLSSAPAPTP